MLRMLTFFLIAGYVARLSFHRLGAATFFKDRLQRIGMPLVAGWLLLFPALMSAGGIPVAAWEVSVANFPLIHLWFLYLLSLFYLVLALIHPLLSSGRAMHLLLQPWATVLLAAPLCLSLYLQPYWMMWFGIPTPDRSFVPSLPSVLGFGGAFLFGWMASLQPDALGLWARRWPVHLAVACACTAFCLAQAGMTPMLMPVPQGTTKLLFAASYSLGAWSWALALVGMAQRFLDQPSPARRYLADASYWIYLVHLPLVVVLQRALAPLTWPWQLKLLLILATACALMLAAYAMLVRRTVVGVVLNGRKKN
jgi:peptidoglycan/LPS O-acetylase OafA/YrhL